jgi:hypothetical protein
MAEFPRTALRERGRGREGAADVDAWLAEPIAWEFGAPPDGIPMPRMLALLWELRQDVRWHFPNRTPAEILTYLGWCLTQGVRDKCVAPELVAPALAGFLDTPDPELERGSPRNQAQLRDCNPTQPEHTPVAGRDPWAFSPRASSVGTRAFVAEPVAVSRRGCPGHARARGLCKQNAENCADGAPLTRLLRIIAPLYDGSCPEIVRDFPLTRQSRLAVAIWACGTMRRRFGWPESLVGRPWRWLSDVAPAADAFVRLSNLALGLWEISPDLQARYDIGTHEGRSALLDWFHSGGAKRAELDTPTLPLPPPIPSPARAGLSGEPEG